MNHIITEPTSTAQWHSLVHEAEDIAHQQLSETLESYLVFTLIRFTRCPELANTILGIEFLESMQCNAAAHAAPERYAMSATSACYSPASFLTWPNAGAYAAAILLIWAAAPTLKSTTPLRQPIRASIGSWPGSLSP